MHTRDFDERELAIFALALRYGARTGDAERLAHRVLWELDHSPTVHLDMLEHATAICQFALDKLATAQVNEPQIGTACHKEPDGPTIPAGVTLPDNPMLAGRILKALGRLYRYDGQIASLGAILSRIEPTHKRHHVRKYERHKRHGEFRTLATPAHEYSIWYWDEERHAIGLDVPKIVFDAYLATPEKDALGRTV